MHSIKNSCHLLYSLLPYDIRNKSATDLPHIVKHYFFLLKASQQTAVALKTNQWRLFDPLVKENFCQIRALKIACEWSQCKESLSQKVTRINSLLDAFKEYSTKTDQQLREIKRAPLEFISPFDLTLSSTEMFFLQSYLLTLIKTEHVAINSLIRIEKTDTKRWRQEVATTSSSFEYSLNTSLCLKLAKASVDYMRSLASEAQNHALLQKFSDKYAPHYKGLSYLPFFWTTQMIMETALDLRIPIVTWTRQMIKDDNEVLRDFCHVWKPNGHTYEEASLWVEEFHTPMLVFQGISCRSIELHQNSRIWRRELIDEGFNPLNMIAAASADHRQYPESIESLEEVDKDPDLLNNRLIAQQQGFAGKNPTHFFVQHAFAMPSLQLDPFKYRTNSHLQKYHSFYIEMFIQDIALHFTLEKWEHTEKTLEVTLLPAEVKTFQEWLLQEAFFLFIEPKWLEEKGRCISLDIPFIYPHIAASGGMHVSLLYYAKRHVEPSKFLLDHIAFWQEEVSILQFLMQDEANFQDSCFIEAIYHKCMLGFIGYTPWQLMYFEALAKATLYPAISKLALNRLQKMIDVDRKQFRRFMLSSEKTPSKVLMMCLQTLYPFCDINKF